MSDINLDNEENDLLESLNLGEWKSVPNLKKEISEHIQIAKNTMKKDKRVNIRISSRDLEGLQVKAIEDGIPYQTLMASILHKYINGRLIDKRA
jgi:predicted DNA binding CopG/RHH family protein